MRNATVVGILVASSLFATSGAGATSGARQSAAPAKELWPAASALPRAEGKATLIAFVRAGDEQGSARIAELTAAAQQLATRPFVELVYVSAADAGAWQAGAGMARLVDRDGAEAARFGAAAADHVVVYDASGALRYRGAASGAIAALR